jgi:AcrR family transcriptional regulator
MNQVARAADVGIATLYRHFPSRDELAAAVYLSKLDEVTARAREHAQGQDALGSIRIWVAEFASFMLATRGMMDTLRAAWQSATPFTSTATARIAEIVDAFLTVGATDHSVRADLDAMDVTVAILALLSTTPPDDPGTRARRLLNLFIDGLAAQRLQEFRLPPVALQVSLVFELRADVGAQGHLGDLSDLSAWQHVDEFEAFGPLVLGESRSLQVGADVGECRGVLRILRHDISAAALAQPGIGHGHQGYLGHGGMTRD